MSRQLLKSDSLVDESIFHATRDEGDSPSSMLEEFYDAAEDSPKPPGKLPTAKSRSNSGPGSQRNSLEGEGKQYINLKNFTGLTSPPKVENVQDDVSSLSSLSVENTRNHSTDSSTVVKERPLSKNISSALKLFKNIENDDDEDEEGEPAGPPPSSAPGKYEFAHKSLRKIPTGPLGGINDNIYDASNENKQSTTTPTTTVNDEQQPRVPSSSRPPSMGRSSLNNSNNNINNNPLAHPIRKRHDSLQRRSVTVNEEVYLASALFGVNDFHSSMQGTASTSATAHNSVNNQGVPSSSAHAGGQQQQHLGGSSVQDLFKDKVRLAQTLQGHEGPIWAMKFSPNGHYLATGGQDTKVIIWCVDSLPKSNRQFSNDANDSPQNSNPNSSDELDELTLDAEGKPKRNSKRRSTATGNIASSSAFGGLIHNFIYPDTYRVYEGHTHDITDVAWSKSNFLLSSSMDKTVRLWHVSRNDCLQYFRHPDIVTCVDFHPLHDRFFVSGCFDRRLRVWDIIPTGSVREWVSANDTVSCFTDLLFFFYFNFIFYLLLLFLFQFFSDNSS
jgi:WD40 repeat protein